MDDYKALAEGFKDEGNERFQSGDIDSAIQLYTQAIDLDPDNHTYYSNRSAAFMKADSKSKALKDAEKCVEINPNFVKGYNRLGAAQQALKRYENAISTFKKGIELEPNNQSLWSALLACQEAFEADKKERFMEAEIERKREEDYIRRKEAAKERALIRAEEDGDLTAATREPDENDLLDSFFTEITSHNKLSAPIVRPDITDSSQDKELEVHEKYLSQDLGKGIEQVQRLTGTNYQFKNLNPYYVLQLDIDATEEDIKNRYRKLSTKIHPDKLRDEPNAREAFEEVKQAYQRLCEPDQKAIVIKNIEYVKAEVRKDRRRLINKGLKESELPFATFEEEYEVRMFKHFADIEMQRRRSETNLRSYNARDRLKDDQEKEKMLKEAEIEQNWAEIGRREKRVGSWRDFQDEAATIAKKSKISSYKEDTRAETKHGVVKLDQWKRSWK